MKFHPIASIRVFILGLFMAGIAAPPAIAQHQHGRGAPPAGTQSKYDQKKLEAFVTAALAVKALTKKWAPTLHKHGTSEEGLKLRKEATAEYIATIEKIEDITPEEYKQIAQTAVRDRALMAQLRKIFGERSKKPDEDAPDSPAEKAGPPAEKK
jgi:hypothetical protein